MKILSFRIVLVSVAFFMTSAAIAQKTSEGAMPQYLFTEFAASRVVLKNGQVQTPDINYNTVTGKMVFIRDGKYYDLMNTEMVDSVVIGNAVFIPVGKVFFELLYSGKDALFVEYQGALLPAGKTVGYGGTSQLASTDYLSSVNLSGQQYNLPLPPDYTIKNTLKYWIRIDKNWMDFTTEKQFLKLFPDKAARLKSFIKENRIKFERNADMVRLAGFLSEL